jgi:DNA modification methylase
MPQINNNPSIDLDFDGHNTLYATHGLHSYAAKCPPQLVRYGIENFSSPGESILDPMVGSGTTVVEARLRGRNAIGYDIDSLACLIAKVKARKIDDKPIGDATELVLKHANNDIDALKKVNVSRELLARATPPNFYNIDYWFSPDVKHALAVLLYHINQTQMSQDVREFLWVAFSSIILTKVSVANARDIIHSRHHYLEHKNVPDVIDKFEARIRKMRRQMEEYQHYCKQIPPTSIIVEKGDARQLPLENETIDLVFTSPPYATALDYPRAHFLAVAWLQQALGITLEEYKSQGATYIGSERGGHQETIRSDNLISDIRLARSIIDKIEEIDRKKAKLIQRYYNDMYLTLKEIYRVLKPNRNAVIVICPSHIRKIEVPTHRVFTEICNKIGLRLTNEITRTINKKRRVLPYLQKAFGDRMNTEYVLIYQK